MTKKKPPWKKQQRQPRNISLYPLSLDEALRAALHTPPLNKAKAHEKSH